MIKNFVTDTIITIIDLIARALVPSQPLVYSEYMGSSSIRFFRHNQYSTVIDCDCKTSREFNWLFLLRALGGSEACVSLAGGMTQLTAALMRCDKLSKL